MFPALLLCVHILGKYVYGIFIYIVINNAGAGNLKFDMQLLC